MIKLTTDVVQSVSNYIDPGTGSMAFQVFIAFFVGGLFMLKVYWMKVKAFIHRKRGKSD